MIFTANLSDLTDSRDNNFSLMRFVAAAGVVLSHSFILSYNEPNAIPRIIGYLAVNCFFIISGFLVCKSIIERNSMRSFFVARILRIYPALIATVVISVSIVGPLQTSGTVAEYFSDSQTYRYLVKNCLLIFGVEYHLPMVFTDRGPETMVNAPLWTLVYEIYLYLFLGCLGTVFLNSKNGRKNLFSFFVIVLSSVALGLYVYSLEVQPLDTPLVGHSVRFAALFGVGASYYLLRHFVKLSPLILLVLLSALFASKAVPFLPKALLYPILAYVLLFAAYIPRGVLLKFNRVGDYSYGIYIFAYPIQQSIANFYPNLSTLVLFLASFMATLMLSIFSWHLLESKALRLKTSV